MDELNPATISQNNNVAPTPPPAPQPNTVPPPPTVPEIFVHTMESDIRSAQTTGEPVAQPVTPPLRPSGFPTPLPSSAGQSAGQAPITPIPVPTAPAPAPMPDVREMKSGKLLLWFFMLILIVGIGWVTYKYGLPAYRAMMPSEAAPEEAQPTAPEPDSASLGTPIAPAVPATPAVTPLGGAQASMLKIETDGTASSITAALAAEAAKTKSASGTLTEVSILNGGAPMSFATVMGALLPEAKTNGLEGILTAAFDPVFSAYLFYDDRGAWPGYIAKINPESQIDSTTLISRLQAIEESSYKNFFLADPGINDGWKTGQARGKYIDRFVPLAMEGALFNYGIFGDYFIINTSNNGLVKTLDILKL